MKLFCWIIEKSDDSFPVDVADDDTVGDLKEAIMKKKPHTLAGLEADELRIWKVSNFPEHRLFHTLFTPYQVFIKITKDLKNEVSKYQLVDDDIALASETLSDAFPNPVRGDLHVVVQTPFVGEYSGQIMNEGADWSSFTSYLFILADFSPLLIARNLVDPSRFLLLHIPVSPVLWLLPVALPNVPFSGFAHRCRDPEN